MIIMHLILQSGFAESTICFNILQVLLMSLKAGGVGLNLTAV